ncbi:lysosome membrane protein 2-like isoform X1 [Macrobrachium nipponense]|uniref:lysosome membrane protein 2-like isoform X1 n=1 Tax=Macrobrachium nipponense TaxID=159736 RepID=UPI0030C891B4
MGKICTGRRSFAAFAPHRWQAVSATLTRRIGLLLLKLVKVFMAYSKGCVLGLGVVLVGLGIITVVFFDSAINKLIYKELVIRNGTDVYKNWKHPPITPHLRMYFFNLTNEKEFLAGSKPVLQEVGPYCYREHWEKINVKFHDNGTVSYETQKFYFFEREKSIGSEDDVIVSLNIPMVAAISQWRFAARIAKLALSSMLEVLKEKPVVAHTVGELMWGYDDPLLKIAKDILPPDKRLPFDKFGFFINKNGSTDGLFNVFTGEETMKKYGIIDSFNYMKKLDYWKTKECNMLNGTDGSIFPPGVTDDTVLYMFNDNLCRSVPLTFAGDIEQYGIISKRFAPPKDVFADVDKNPNNDCFCVDGPPCLGGGLFNISACKFGSPTAISWPHFYQADQKYLDAVVGLKPDPKRHAFYMDISPRTGTPIRAEARLQINIAVASVPEIKPAAGLRDMMFPIVWFEDAVTEMPGHLVKLLQTAENVPAVTKASMTLAFFVIGGVFVVLASISILATYFNLPVPFLNLNYKSDEKSDDKVHQINPTERNASRPELTGHDNPAVADKDEA